MKTRLAIIVDYEFNGPTAFKDAAAEQARAEELMARMKEGNPHIVGEPMIDMSERRDRSPPDKPKRIRMVGK